MGMSMVEALYVAIDLTFSSTIINTVENLKRMSPL
jgi:hypothetical protein